MSSDEMNLSRGKSNRHTLLAHRFSPGSPELASELSYSNMLMNQNGTLLSQEEIQGMRVKQGFCPTCTGTPVKLFEVRKTKLNPLWSSKEPLTVPNECYKGVCLKCHPVYPTAAMENSTGKLRTSMQSAQTQGTSSRSAFIGGKLTVTRIDDSQRRLSESMQTESSFQTASEKVNDSMISALTQEPGLDSFKTAQDFAVFGMPVELGDSANSSRLRGEASSNHRRKSPPLVLSGIPTEARNDSLDVSRRNSIPIPSGPELSNVPKAPKKKPPPPSAADADANQQQILNALSRRGMPAKPSYDSAQHGHPQSGTGIKPKKRVAGRQAAETMDRLRAAYERTFCSTSISDEISALTVDIEQSNSSGLERSNNSGGISYDSDSLLEEFSVPDFSMGTGDAIKSHRMPKPSKAMMKKARASIPRKKEVQAPVSNKNKVSVDPQRPPDQPRKPPPAPKSFANFDDPHFGGDYIVKPKADVVHKPKAQPAASLPKEDGFAPTRKYMVMDSGVSAIPGPPEKLGSLTRVDLRSPEPSDPANPPNFARDHANQKQDRNLVTGNTVPAGLASIPSYEDGSTLAPPSLVDQPDTYQELTVETKTAGDVISLDSKLEEVESLINDVVAAENAEFLAELLSNTMRSHRERVDIQSFCLRQIWDMSKYNSENKGTIMETGLYDCIISAMKDFPSSVDVQESGCGALWSLSVNQFNRVILVRAGACERILRGLDTHLNNERFVQTALGALRTLSPEREARMVINHMLGSQRVVRAMGLHRFVVDIQRDGCAFLSNVAVDMERQEVSVVSNEELQAVVRAMRDHLKNESVITSACFTLKNFSYEERNVRNLRRFDDVVALLEDAAQYATKANCRRDAAEVLKRIQLLQTEDTALEEIAFSSLMQAMRRASTETNPAKQVEESVTTITEVITEYYWSIRLICFGFESLLSLADKSEAHLNRILSPKTLRVIVNTMKEHQPNPKVQQRGCELLKFLAEPSNPVNRMEICMEEGCNVIVSALKNHRGDESVMIPAYAALEALAQEPSCADEIQRSGGWQIIRDYERDVLAAAETELSEAVEEAGKAVQVAEEREVARRLSAS